MRMTILLAFTLVGSAAYAQPASQQTAPQPAEAKKTWTVDARWASWVGCWRSEDDLSGTGARLCITPETVAGVKLQTIDDDEVRLSETIIPDKVTRPVDDRDCTGTTRSEWSRNNQRLFRFTEVTCGTERVRKLSGVAFLIEGPVLVDVMFADQADNKSVRVRRFYRSGNQKLADGSVAPRPTDLRSSAIGAAWTVEDVIEASGKISPDAVQAAISENGAGFRLDKSNLLAMDKAGVSDGVIDLMVALSYPKRFVVERAGTPVDQGSVDQGLMGSSFGWWDPFLSPMLPYSMMMRDCYSSYYGYGPSYGCSRYYSAFGYGYPGYNYGYSYGYSPYGYPGWVIVDSGTSNTAPGISENGSTDSRVVNGRGYTQIRNREPVPVIAGSGSGYGGNSTSGSGTSGTNSTGSSGVSSGGYSGGGSSGGGDSGRTAVPRGPGGGR
jgi:hypothetical protein